MAHGAEDVILLLEDWWFYSQALCGSALAQDRRPYLKLPPNSAPCGRFPHSS